MRIISVLLIACALALGLVLIGQIDPHNYVKMYFNGYLIEFNLLGFCLIILFVVVLLFLVFRLISFIRRSPNNIRRWKHHKNTHSANQNLGAGYLSLICGDWRKAETQLIKKSSFSDIAYVNFLAAAKAAQELGEYSKRDEYLKKAYQLAPKQTLAIGITKAQLHHQAGQNEQALATLNDIYTEGKNNPQYTAMLAQAYASNQNWQGLKDIIPSIKKQKSLPEEQIQFLQNQVFRYDLNTSDNPEQVWKSTGKDQKNQVDNIISYVSHLSQIGKTKIAEKLLINALKKDWDDTLLKCLTGLEGINQKSTLAQIERWLITYPENPQLHLAAGKTALAMGNIDTAMVFLKTAISKAQLAEAYSLMAKALQQSNQNDLALEYYQTAMQKWVETENTPHINAPKKLDTSA